MSRTPRHHPRPKLVAIIVCAFFAAAPAWAQLTPSQPIRIIVSAPAGGLGDIAARIVAHKLSEDGHPAIVENRVGGNGIVATEAAAKVRPDGANLIVGNHSTLAILPHMSKVGYDPIADFAPIALMLTAPNVLVVRTTLPVSSAEELIAYGKTTRLTNATQGIGASGTCLASSSGNSPESTLSTCTTPAHPWRSRTL